MTYLGMCSRYPPWTLTRAVADVQAFDKNRDGYIDEHELRQTMHELGMKLSAEDISAMMSQAGCRITGRVYYEGSRLAFI